MKKMILTYAFLIAYQLSVSSQTTSPQVVATGGDFLANATAHLSMTIGELTASETFSGGNNMLTQGFQQNELNGAGIGENKNDIPLACWPNPTTGNIQLSFTPAQAGRLSIHVYDALGQHTGLSFIRELIPGEYLEMFSLDVLRAGFYFLDVAYVQHNGTTLHTNKKINVINQY